MAVPIKILLVDDDQDDRMFFKKALEFSAVPVELHLAKSTEEAMVYLEDKTLQPPNIIFVDVNMPDIDGFMFVQTIRANKLTAKTTIIMYSTSDNPALVKQAILMGADSYIKKPNDFKQLQLTLKKALEQTA